MQNTGIASGIAVRKVVEYLDDLSVDPWMVGSVSRSLLDFFQGDYVSDHVEAEMVNIWCQTPQSLKITIFSDILRFNPNMDYYSMKELVEAVDEVVERIAHIYANAPMEAGNL